MYLILGVLHFNPSIIDWATFWGKVAQEFSDNEYILGYELINEPWAGIVGGYTCRGPGNLTHCTISLV